LQVVQTVTALIFNEDWTSVTRLKSSLYHPKATPKDKKHGYEKGDKENRIRKTGINKMAMFT
jgi:hypothetical protein